MNSDRQRVLFEPLHEFGGNSSRRVEMRQTVTHQRHGNRRQAQETPFHRCGDGTGIDNIVAEICAVVDSGNDKIRFFLEKSRQAQGGRNPMVYRLPR